MQSHEGPLNQSLRLFIGLLDAFEVPKIFRHNQGRNEARWRPGQEAPLAPPCSNLRSFGSKCSVLKKVLVTLLGLIGARGIVPPSLHPWPQLC